jgi:predicted GNAT superfamily acetyltransferase
MTEPLAKRDIEVCHCAALAEYEECVRIEHATQGEEIAVPSALFVVAHHAGGQVLAAFDGAKMVGFTLALAGVRAGKPFLHSHMTAVLPEFRDHGTIRVCTSPGIGYEPRRDRIESLTRRLEVLE